MRKLTVLLLTLLSIEGYSQSVEDLEYDLSVFENGINYTEKIDKARTLLQLDPFNYIGTRYLFDYYKEIEVDSVSKYFDYLMKLYPQIAEPRLLRAELLYYEHDQRNKSEYTNWKLAHLNDGLNVDPRNPNVLYQLSKVYYDDFIYPLEKQDFSFFFGGDEPDSTLLKSLKKERISVFENSADSSYKYFQRLWEIEKDDKDVYYFPIKQLECFLKKESSFINREAAEQFNQNCYFPSWYFANLSDDWQCDFSTNYLFEVELSKWGANGMKLQLSDLQEPCLYNSQVSSNNEIYRFTWLRSFHNSIAIRVEKSENKYKLIWKLGKGAGGYEPRGIKRKGVKRISSKNWNKFIVLLEQADFENSPNQTYVPMTDGASWTLEHKTSSTFKAHDTNEPKGKFKEACLFLLKLSGIRIKKENIY